MEENNIKRTIDDINNKFRSEIAKVMNERELTQTAVASMVGVSRQAISVELMRNLKIETMAKIADALNLDITLEITERDENK